VLTASPVKKPGPAASCRRFLLCTTLLAAGSLAASCGDRPQPDVDGARRAVKRTVRLARPTAPSQARYLERLAETAETATAGEIYAPFWQPTPGRAQAAWLRAVRAARAIASDIRAQTSIGRKRYETLMPIIKADLARAVAEIRETGMGRREAAAIVRAQTAFANAGKFAAAGQYSRAADKLQQAREDTRVVHRGWSSLHARFGDPKLVRLWRGWAEATIEESRRHGSTAIIVDKLHRRLMLYQRGFLVKSFPAELGANGLRRKEHAGDRATPEGLYRVVQLKQGRSTKYYKALLINYPNDEDRERYAAGKRHGTIPRRAGIGNLIEIHGDGGEGRDWTDGCVALTNVEMDWLYARVMIGTPVTIVGTYEQ
jgi:L,D-peptidoglycan transpeptidase YkuD (ErfK/YbiS/YcfS/YnhG family)